MYAVCARYVYMMHVVTPTILSPDFKGSGYIINILGELRLLFQGSDVLSPVTTCDAHCAYCVASRTLEGFTHASRHRCE
jgi:hypothetical protein